MVLKRRHASFLPLVSRKVEGSQGDLEKCGLDRKKWVPCRLNNLQAWGLQTPRLLSLDLDGSRMLVRCSTFEGISHLVMSQTRDTHQSREEKCWPEIVLAHQDCYLKSNPERNDPYPRFNVC